MTMITLAFDTAMNAGSVAVVEDDAVLAHLVEANARSLAERLVPMVEEALANAEQTYQTIDRIGVTIGPGTFTGMRIGMATARAMALAADKPLIGATTLEVIAQQAADEYLDKNTINVCFDARRGEVYLQTFERRDGELFPHQAPVLCSVNEAVAEIATGSGVLVGSGAPLMGAPPGMLIAPGFEAISALTLAQLVRRRPVPEHMPEPLYLRAPDAKLPGGKTLAPS
jgi:tRNA threonylcarbamoyladenosine biosynthesis protein TsaB